MKPRCELEKFSSAFMASEVEGGNNSCVPRGRLISSAFTTSDVEGGNNSCVPRGRSISVSAETGREDSSALGGFPHRFLLSGRQLVHLFREAAHSQRTQEPLPLHWQHLRRPTRLEMRSLSNLDCSIASSTWGSRRGFSSIPQKTTSMSTNEKKNRVSLKFVVGCKVKVTSSSDLEKIRVRSKSTRRQAGRFQRRGLLRTLSKQFGER